MRKRNTILRCFAIAVLLSVCACSRDNATLQIRVVTALVPGSEFRNVQTTILSRAGSFFENATASEAVAHAGSDYAHGHVAATFEVATGSYRAQVRLLRPNGTMLVERTVDIALEGDAVVSVHLTRDCVGVICPSPGGSPESLTCLNGRCVDPRCSNEHREFCPDISFCDSATDCASTAACAERSCDNGVCIAAPVLNACVPTEWCNPDLGAGCQSTQPPTPAGVSVCGTICTHSATPCQFGYWTCEDPLNPVCTPLANRPSGFVCGDGALCDSVGACQSISVTPNILVTPRTGLRVSESGTSADIQVVLTTQPAAPVFVLVASNDTTEATASPSTLAFTPLNWNAPQTVTVRGVDDFAIDGDQGLTIVFGAATSSDSQYNGIDPDDAEVTTVDDESASVLVSRTSGLSTNEDGSTDTFEVSLTMAPSSDVSFTLSSDRPTEATVSPTTLTFTHDDFASPHLVTVTGVDDDFVDGTQAFTIVAAAPITTDPRFAEQSMDDVHGANSDNDSPALAVSAARNQHTAESGTSRTFRVRLATLPASDVTVPFATSDATEASVAPAFVVFTASNWASERVITVTGVNDSLPDGNQPFAVVTGPSTSADPSYDGLVASDVDMINDDDDAAGIVAEPSTGLVTAEWAGGEAFLGVRLQAQPISDVTLSITSTRPEEAVPATSSLTFTPLNWNTQRTLTITNVNDTVVDGDQSYDIVIHVASTADPAFTALADVSVDGVNIDDDAADVYIQPAIGLITRESGTSDVFAITLTASPAANVTIALSSSNVGEGSVSPMSVTFTPTDWAMDHLVTVTGVDDAVMDGDIAYSIVTAPCASVDANYNGLDPIDISITNRDDEIPAAVDVTPVSGLATTELGGTATFSVVLRRPTSASALIAISSSNLNEGTVSPSSLTFTTANWYVPQTVTVTGVNDGVIDGNTPFTIVTANIVSADSGYSGLAVADVSAVNRTSLRQDAYVKASNTDMTDNFHVVALSDDGSTLAVGAPYEDSSATGINGNQSSNATSDSGAVYIYRRIAGAWALESYIKASNTGASDQFGSAVSLSSDGSTLAVGATTESSNAVGIGGNQLNDSASESGAVYIFGRIGAAWAQSAYIKASNTESHDWFGSALSLSGDGSVLVVGAPRESSSATGVDGNQSSNAMAASGAAYVFRRTLGIWAQDAYLKASNTNNNDVFGNAVRIAGDGNTIVSCGYFEESNATGINGNQADNSANFAGACYVFVHGTTWTQQAYVKASNTEANDVFGWVVDLSWDGNVLAISANHEGSAALGVGGNQLDNSQTLSGAVYVFRRSGAMWAQEAYLKASRRTWYLGYSLAMSSDGTVIAAGAHNDVGCDTGVDNDTMTGGCASSGAGFIWRYSSGAWLSPIYVKASNPGTSDGFGRSLDISGDGHTLAFGAQQEGSDATGVNGDQTNNLATDSGAVYVFSNH